MVAIGHVPGWEPRTRHRGPAPGLVLLFGVTACAVVASVIICGLLTLLFGHLSGWVTFAVYAVQVLPAIFFAGAVFSGGEERPANFPPC